VYKGSFFPTSSPTPVGGGVFDDSYSNRGEVESCISLMARDGEHFFMCFLAICISPFERVLFSSIAPFFIGSLILREFSFLSSLCILFISPLSDV
jgi:hypothetical protein